MRFSSWLSQWHRFWRSAHPRSRKVLLPKLSRTDRQALCAALADHPGWHYIMASLENHKAAAELRRDTLTRNVSLTTPAEPLVRELIRLDEAIHWLGSISNTVKRAGAMPSLVDAPDEKNS